MLFLTHKILDLNSITECPTGNHPQKTIRNGKRKEKKKKKMSELISGTQWSIAKNFSSLFPLMASFNHHYHHHHHLQLIVVVILLFTSLIYCV